MIEKTVRWVCVLAVVVILTSPAFADQSIGYQQYFNEGLKAFKQHNDRKALRCFRIAGIYDPNDADLKRYLAILEQRGIVLKQAVSRILPVQSIGYRYYLQQGIEAYKNHDDKKAVRLLTIAVIFYPGSMEADRYLRLLSVPVPAFISPSVRPVNIAGQRGIQTLQPVSSVQTAAHLNNSGSQVPPMVPKALPQASAVQPSAVVLQPVIYVGMPKPKQPPMVLSMSKIISAGQAKPTLFIEFHSSVILEGEDIQRFLVVDEGFAGVKPLDRDHLEIDALRIGTTFLHVWDSTGRHTFYVEVVFPKTVSSAELEALNNVQHSVPFRFAYSNDWSSYYLGKNIPALKRQSYDFNQSLAVTGETPYGLFDASGSYSDFNGFSNFDSYTVGLSQIPLPGTSNFNVRGFDALRYSSALTMPSTRLRGAFADVDLMDDLIGLSLSHGQEQPPLGFVTSGSSQFNNSYIDDIKLTLFPKSDWDRYSFVFAAGYGPDREPYLTNHVYSLEGQHKFNDFLTLNAEEGSDASHDSTLASLRWEDGGFDTGLHFRNIDKDYSTISSLPSNQGETGVSWTTEADLKGLTASAFLETYRDHLDPNLNDPSALNYDANGHVRANIASNLWTDTDLNYVDTPGEISPRRSLGINEKLSRSFGIWNSLKAVLFAGGGYQNSHSPDADSADFDREDVLAGLEVPLTNEVSAFGNYEYDWLSQPSDAGGKSNPGIVNTGLEYLKQFNSKFSITSQLVYRNELGVDADSNSFLSGQESVILTAGFNYTPTPDISIFADTDASKVISHVGNQPYDDFEVHVGMRVILGGASYWDPQGTVMGTVFKDKTGEGKYTPGDEGIPDVKIKVGDKTVSTDQFGHYSIKIRAKGVLVEPVLDSIPGGLIYSTSPSLNVPVFQGRRSRADFGFISQTGIYGIVFVDQNNTGVPNSVDKFIGKVRVILDGKIIKRSDPHGAFYFRKVTPGRHTLTIDINSLALNMVPLVKLKNEIDVPEGTNYMFNVPVQIKKAEGDPD